MTDGLVIGAIILGIAFAAIAGRKSQASMNGMEDTPVSIDNIRKGVANGWYTALLTTVDGIPAVRLSGKTAAGKDFTDVYPIRPEDWQTLKSEGYQVVTK